MGAAHCSLVLTMTSAQAVIYARVSYKDEGVALLDLARNAERPFAQQDRVNEKRRLLNFLLSNCAWEGGKIAAAFRQPFDMLSETERPAPDRSGAPVRRKVRFGWGTWIRTKILRVRVECSTVELSPNHGMGGNRTGRVAYRRGETSSTFTFFRDRQTISLHGGPVVAKLNP
jgi:hypothetical protein